ncbi:MAG: ABC transporter ATP-binding protein [Sphaerochaetaceae bacterium]|nr:ABC transporter ATP-binding protein [Sphaerochaetaceae bacterium]
MQLLSTEGISKNFGTFWANRKISFHLDSGEIISILGENGAGKTTLMNMLYGLYQPSEGSISIKGSKVAIGCPRDAIDMGISMVHQHFMLVDALTVMENIILGNEPKSRCFIDTETARKKVDGLSQAYGLGVKSDSMIGKLSVGEKQRVELLKALYNDCDILILDEPTAVLTPNEVTNFFDILKRLRDAGKGIILISHKLRETLMIANRIYIMRAGEFIDETVPERSTVESLSELMVGRPLNSVVSREDVEYDKVVLDVRCLDSYSGKGKVLDSINFKLKAGRILGLAGVDGNGQTELVELIVGMRGAERGNICLDGRDITCASVRKRLDMGIGYIPEDRQAKGLVGQFDLEKNLILGYQRDKRFSAHGIINWKKVHEYSKSVINAYDVRCRGVLENVGALSGGNQQKVVIGRVLEADPELIIAAQPTRGVDIGAVEYIHQKLIEMRNRGKGVLLISADLDEILKLSDDVAVMYEGKIVCLSENGRYTKTELGSFMTGGRTEEVADE